ncbi:DNA-directed RNA polymerase subunit alpha [Thermodesulfatator autotrophicus]|uniref:DNA-directed RNA polymerase subunit alpha n=1 Tax=Thermodesulfatator autotrophicus TaxID=1795632 RepID=A0A177E678_9BACT|nr:DNA-directed RNA polymerase subunit alpha [Thermodesulfatator autotrophicus]OAG27216.1 DNA-directed RNA polymerase subunit alpha [Thermodesulfatator autotrophicus]
MAETKNLISRNWLELIKPKGVQVHNDSRPPFYGKFVIEPLERGFGVTIGNALRRVLLSSLQGAAITWVKIDGTTHEFSSLPGVREDVIDIILNLKGVRFKLYDEEPKTFILEKAGPGEVKAGDIQTDGQGEIVNPDHHIATLSKDGHLKMELHVEWGKGYRPADPSSVEEIGVIPVDAIFSPIQRVNFNVTQARVGRSSDFDRLVMEIWTDGTVDAQDAMAYAAKILKDQLTVFINFTEEETTEEKTAEESKPEYYKYLDKRIDELELSVRSANCLKNANIRYIGELVQKTESEMLKTKNFGRKSLNELKNILSSMGLSFGMQITDWKPPEEAKEEA